METKRTTWRKTSMTNLWENKNNFKIVHVFKGHNKGKPTGNWIVRIGKTDKDLLKNQNKFKTKPQAIKYARTYMKRK